MGISCSPIALLIDLKDADKWRKLVRTLFATVETLSSQKEQPDGGPEKERSVPVEPGLWLFRFSRPGNSARRRWRPTLLAALDELR
jgi:hypothetical protein